MYIVFEELADAALGFSHPDYQTNIKYFSDKLDKATTEEPSSKIEDTAEYWKVQSEKKEKIIQECKTFLELFTPTNEVINMMTVQHLTYFQIACVAMMKEFFRDIITDCSFLEIGEETDYSDELEMCQKFLTYIIPTGLYIEEAIEKCPKEFIIFVLKREVDSMEESCAYATGGMKCSENEYKTLYAVVDKIRKRLTDKQDGKEMARNKPGRERRFSRWSNRRK